MSNLYVYFSILKSNSHAFLESKINSHSLKLYRSDRQYFIGLCIDVRTCKLIPLEFIKYNLESVFMFM